MFWFLVAVIGAGIFFANGIDALLEAWQLPEYSHGPLIPVLSAFLFLKQLKDYPINPDVARNRWPGVILVVISILMGALGILANIGDIVAYALILWVGGVLLVSWGWDTGKHFWPGVVHLVYMLPLPGVIYYKITTALQMVSSELGVWFLQLASVPVFLDGNIIDLGILKLHVAEACSGLRYMFPIMSFSYIFATLYRGPVWHKVTLLLAAVPIAIFMNSVRIAVAGIIVQHYGVGWLDGFSHFFEGWVIFLICIVILFGLAWVLLFLQPKRMSLVEALDLDTDGLGQQAMRVQYVRPSVAMITTAVVMLMAVTAVQLMPERGGGTLVRDRFEQFPRQIGEWRQIGLRETLEPAVVSTLGADDYHQVNLSKPGEALPVGLFMAWYDDQSKGGVHSPEICLPGAGWEIAWLERTDITQVVGTDTEFNINRAIIQKGETRMMVYYWFQQRDRRIASDVMAKYWLMMDGITTGRTDGAIVRLTTLIDREEGDEVAEARLRDVLISVQDTLPRFIPTN
ncbi:VPLPA-CTERM-specific exosortase XrtD [Octadecabacter sp. 1_MG-2023]|uniref:VPLPA-CTERM-specific exosortase XrtD n=1 Tax=unclassified Octadecabacter TaxID=196158 RepID=UPI002090C416|nr:MULTISPECIES: VPLPA-CTERM-specific exosortase XrtD [unclassified Octadecabacter]MDO6736052.1 VPLPA-CTERM-specific exosortase XrtD [Octadecabacter sp. 1_MG-2023]